MHCLSIFNRRQSDKKAGRRKRDFLLVFLASPVNVTRLVFSFFQHSAPLNWQHFVVGIFKHWMALASSFGYRYGAVSEWLQVVTKSLLSTYMWKLTHFNKEHLLLNRKKCQALFSYATKSCNKSIDLQFPSSNCNFSRTLRTSTHTHRKFPVCPFKIHFKLQLRNFHLTLPLKTISMKCNEKLKGNYQKTNIKYFNKCPPSSEYAQLKSYVLKLTPIFGSSYLWKKIFKWNISALIGKHLKSILVTGNINCEAQLSKMLLPHLFPQRIPFFSLANLCYKKSTESLLCFQFCFLKIKFWASLDSEVKNLPVKAGDKGWIPNAEIPHSSVQPSLFTATESVLYSPGVTNYGGHIPQPRKPPRPRASVPQREKPPQREACAAP